MNNYFRVAARNRENMPGVVACIYIPATLETEFRNSRGSISVGGKCPSIDGWTVRPSAIQHRDRNLTKSWKQDETY